MDPHGRRRSGEDPYRTEYGDSYGSEKPTRIGGRRSYQSHTGTSVDRGYHSTASHTSYSYTTTTGLHSDLSPLDFDFTATSGDTRIQSRPSYQEHDYDTRAYGGNDGRAFEGNQYVGLVNGGSTCYMNSVLQQLYHAPSVRKAICDVGSSRRETNVFTELKSVFNNLEPGKPSPYRPVGFWRVFKMFHQPIDTSRQQDAFEFYSNLTQQLDEILQAKDKHRPLWQALRGTTITSHVFQICHHRYELDEEEFYALSVPLTERKLEPALAKCYMNKEMLAGRNQFTCPTCKIKGPAEKRTMLQTLPPVLFIHLKRFEYDVRAQRTQKQNNYFEFPFELDMGGFVDNRRRLEYKLVGVVIHSGEAYGGHYYSYIKDRNKPAQWLRCDDRTVSRATVDDSTLRSECFGQTDSQGCLGRWWSSSGNAYILVYEKNTEQWMESPPTPMDVDMQEDDFVPRTSGTTTTATLPDQPEHQHSTTHTAARTRSGSRYQILKSITDAMKKEIDAFEKAGAKKHKYKALSVFKEQTIPGGTGTSFLVDDDEARNSVKLALMYLTNNFLNKKRNDDLGGMKIWCRYIYHIVSDSKKACDWAVDNLPKLKPKYFADSLGETVPHQGCDYIESLLLRHEDSNVRDEFAQLLLNIIEAYTKHTKKLMGRKDSLMVCLFAIVHSDAFGRNETSCQFFWMLRTFMDHEEKRTARIRTVLDLGGFEIVKSFLQVDTRGREGGGHFYGLTQWNEDEPVFAYHAHHVFATMISHILTQNRPERALPEFLTHTHDRRKTSEFSDYMSKALEIYFKTGDESIAEMMANCSQTHPERSKTILLETLEAATDSSQNTLHFISKVLERILGIADSLQKDRLTTVLKDERGLLAIVVEQADNPGTGFDDIVRLIVNLSKQHSSVKDYLIEEMKSDILNYALKKVRDEKLRREAKHMFSHSSNRKSKTY